MSWSIFNANAGTTPSAFARATLKDLGVPQTDANTQSLIAWMLLEGGGGTYNPLNTTLSTPNVTGELSPNPGVKDYSSAETGAAATAQTIDESFYPEILASLKSGKGLYGANTGNELYTWSGGYSTIDSTYQRAAQYMSGGTGTGPTQETGIGLGTILNWQSDFVKGLEWGPKWIYGATVGPITKEVDGLAGIAGAIAGLTTTLSNIGQLFAKLMSPPFWLRVGAFFAGIAALFGGIYFLRSAT